MSEKPENTPRQWHRSQFYFLQRLLIPRAANEGLLCTSNGRFVPPVKFTRLQERHHLHRSRQTQPVNNNIAMPSSSSSSFVTMLSDRSRSTVAREIRTKSKPNLLSIDRSLSIAGCVSYPNAYAISDYKIWINITVENAHTFLRIVNGPLHFIFSNTISDSA